jgi:CHAT domain-containing protein
MTAFFAKLKCANKKPVSNFSFLFFFLLLPGMAGAQKKMPAAKQLVARADSLYGLKSYKEAAKAFRVATDAAVEEQAWDVHNYCCRFAAQTYSLMNIPDSAVNFLQSSIQVVQNHQSYKHLPRLYLTLGRIMADMYNDNALERALAVADSLGLLYLQPNDLFHAELALTRSRVAIRRDDYINARKYGLRCLEVNRAAGKTDMKDLYRIHLSLGMSEMALLNFEEGMRHQRKLEEWLNQLPEDQLPVNAGLVYEQLGSSFATLGEYKKALEYHQKAVVVNERNYGKNTPKVYFNYMNIAEDYTRQKDWDNALVNFTKAMAIADSNRVEPGMATYIKINVAKCLQKTGRSDDAKKMWSAVLKNVTPEKEDAKISVVWEAMGTYYRECQMYPEALNAFNKEVELILQTHGSAAELCDAYTSIGRIYAHQKKWLEALASYDKVFDLYAQSEQKATSADYMPAHESVVSILSHQAAVLYDMTNTIGEPQKRQQYLHQALKRCRHGIGTNRQSRQSYYCSHEENFEWVDQNQQLFANGVQVAHQLAIETGQQLYKDEAFLIADQSKALLLQEALQRAEAKTFAYLPDSLLQQDAALSRTIAYLERKVLEAAFTKDTLALVDLRDDQLFRAKRAYERLLTIFAQQYPDYYSLRYDTVSLQISQLRKTLPPDAVLISYLPQPERNLLYIFTLTSNSPVRTIVVPLDTQNNTRVLTLRRLLQSPFLIQTPKRNQFIDLSHQLYKQYIGPIADQLKGYKQLVIIGDGTTQSLPFDILLSNDKKAPFEQINFLIRDFDISYHYSAQLYTRQQKAVERVNVFTFAPVFSKISPEMRGSSRTNDNDDGSFQSLPYSEQEVKEIGQAFQNKNIVELTGEQANEHALKQQLRKPWHIVHIASHSFANLEQPKFSGIACYPQKEEKDGEDGIVYVNEIYTLPMQADLVVLSSCESGLGQIRPGEGMLGLNRAFLYSGVHNIIFSLWTANDRVTSNLMRAFYKNVAASMPYNKALNDAKRQLLNNPTTASPSFWANFQHIGH